MNSAVSLKERIDIIFAYADVFGSLDANNIFKPFKPHEIIDANKMFKTIVKAATSKEKSSQKALRIEKRILNFKTFDHILDEGPRLLFVLCHGTRDSKKLEA